MKQGLSKDNSTLYRIFPVISFDLFSTLNVKKEQIFCIKITVKDRKLKKNKGKKKGACNFTG